MNTVAVAAAAAGEAEGEAEGEEEGDVEGDMWSPTRRRIISRGLSRSRETSELINWT